MVSKELFLKTLQLIKDLEKRQDAFVDSLESLSPGNYCDCFLFSDPINQIIKILGEDLNDTEDLITYYLYEFADLPEDTKREQIEKYTPECASDEAIYDYLVAKIKEGK